MDALHVAEAHDAGQSLEEMLDCLEPRERSLGRTVLREPRRRHFALGRLAARAAVRRVVGLERVPRFAILRGSHGEPLVESGGALDDVAVSLAHSGSVAVACAWRRGGGGRSFGVDVERLRPTDVGGSPWAFDAEERERIALSAEPGWAALAAWTAKEAAWKALGLGPDSGPEALAIGHTTSGSAGREIRVRCGPAGGPGLRVRLRTIDGGDGRYLVAQATAPSAGGHR